MCGLEELPHWPSRGINGDVVLFIPRREVHSWFWSSRFLHAPTLLHVRITIHILKLVTRILGWVWLIFMLRAKGCLTSWVSLSCPHIEQNYLQLKIKTSKNIYKDQRTSAHDEHHELISIFWKSPSRINACIPQQRCHKCLYCFPTVPNLKTSSSMCVWCMH